MRPAAIVTVALMSGVIVSLPVLASMDAWMSAAALDWLHPGVDATAWAPYFATLQMLGAGLAVASGTSAPPRSTVAIGAGLTAIGHLLVASHLSDGTAALGGASVAFGTGMVVPAAYAAIGDSMVGLDAARLIPIAVTIGIGGAAERWAWWARSWMVRMDPQPVLPTAVSLAGAAAGLTAAAAATALVALDRRGTLPRDRASWRFTLGVATIASVATGASTFGLGLPDARGVETLIQWLPGTAALLTFGLGVGLAGLLHRVGARPPMLLAAGLGAALSAIGIGLKHGAPIPEVVQVASACLAVGGGLTSASVLATLADGRRLAVAPLALYLGAAPVAAASVVGTLTSHLGTGAVLVAAVVSAAAGLALGLASLVSERPFDLPDEAPPVEPT